MKNKYTTMFYVLSILFIIIQLLYWYFDIEKSIEIHIAEVGMVVIIFSFYILSVIIDLTYKGIAFSIKAKFHKIDSNDECSKYITIIDNEGNITFLDKYIYNDNKILFLDKDMDLE